MPHICDSVLDLCNNTLTFCKTSTFSNGEDADEMQHNVCVVKKDLQTKKLQ